MNALIYARISTQGQSDGASLESQAEACREYAAAHGYTVTREVSEIFSGSYLFDRPLLNECREEIRAGRYDALIVYDIDRLSRNVPHLGILLDECQRYNTNLLFVKTDLEHSPEGMLLFAIRGYLAEAERLKIIERTTRGRRAKAKSGNLSFKRKLFGYELDAEGKRQVYEPEAETVRFMYSAFLQGESLRAIGSALNKKGVPTPTGKGAWWANTVRGIIINPAYCGRTVIFRQRKTSRFVAGERVVSTHHTDAADQVELPAGTTPAIISESDFNRALTLLGANRTGKRARPKRDFLLRGLILCAACGRRMSPQVSYKWRSYVCVSKQNPAVNCGTRMLNASEGEAVVWEWVSKVIKNRRRIERLVKFSQSEKAKQDSLRSSLSASAAAIKKVEGELQNLIDRMGSVTEAAWARINQRITQKTEEIEKLKKERRALSEKAARSESVMVDAQMIKEKLELYGARLEHLTFEDKTDILHLIDARFTWDGEKLAMKMRGGTVLW